MKNLIIMLIIACSFNVQAQDQIDVTLCNIIQPINGEMRTEYGTMIVKYQNDSVLFADASSNFKFALITSGIDGYLALDVEDGLQVTTFVGTHAIISRYVDASTGKLEYLKIESAEGIVWALATKELMNAILGKY